jgi:hypothetical protein
VAAAVQAAYRVNVGNLRDTRHSTRRTPPAAKAEQETVGLLCLNFHFWQVADLFPNKRMV